jgi:hypothetical protein
MKQHLPHRFKIFCDVETSGSCPIKNGVISACILIVDHNCNVIDEFTRFVRPPDLNRSLWSIEAQGVHGITLDQVKTFMSNDQFCYELLCFLGKYKDIFPFDFVCHASPKGWFDFYTKKWKIIKWFDYFFLEWCFRKSSFANKSSMVYSFWKTVNTEKLISTVQMARDAGYKGNKLSEWADRLNLKLNHHNASSDTYACLEVYKFLNKNNIFNRDKNG